MPHLLDSHELPNVSADLRQCFDPISLSNLQPIWSDAIGAFVMSFDDSRITQKSIKNYKLTRAQDSQANTALQFGRRSSRTEFAIDFSWPLSPLQSFEIALASLDPKLGV